MELLCTISLVSTQGISLLLIHKENACGSHSALAEWHMNIRENRIKVFSRSGLAEVVSRHIICDSSQCIGLHPGLLKRTWYRQMYA